MMFEWHQPPEYFLEHWTDEQFELFWEKRNERVIAQSRTIEELREGRQAPGHDAKNIINDMQMFQMMGIGRA